MKYEIKEITKYEKESRTIIEERNTKTKYENEIQNTKTSHENENKTRITAPIVTLSVGRFNAIR